MGHHRNEAGQFQSDKTPGLLPDWVSMNLTKPTSLPAARVLAESYINKKPEFAGDLGARLDELHGPGTGPSLTTARERLEDALSDARELRQRVQATTGRDLAYGLVIRLQEALTALGDPQ